MIGDDIKIVVSQDLRDTKSKTEHIVEYIESLKAIEDCIKPYKEQKKELKKEYLERKWLSKEDITLSNQALRLLKDDVDMGDLIDMYNSLKSKYERDDE